MGCFVKIGGGGVGEGGLKFGFGDMDYASGEGDTSPMSTTLIYEMIFKLNL